MRRLLERANNLAIEELSLVAATCLDNGADLRRLNELSPEQRMPFIQSAHNGVRVVLPRSPKPVGAGKPIQAPAQLTDGDVLRAIVDHADIYLRRESDEASPSATGEALSMLEQGQWHQRPAVVARIGEALAEALLINVKESWTHQLSNAA